MLHGDGGRNELLSNSGTIPFACSVCSPSSAPSNTGQVNGTIDTFSAISWQGWAISISATGGKGAFPARWPAVMLNGRYLLEVDESPGRCSTRPPTWNRRRKARFTGVIILQPNWRYPLPESQDLAGQQSPAGENHLGYARGSTWKLLQQALQGEGRRRWRSERRPLPGAAGRWPRPASRLWRLGCR